MKTTYRTKAFSTISCHINRFKSGFLEGTNIELLFISLFICIFYQILNEPPLKRNPLSPKRKGFFPRPLQQV